jgi:hypothetical protein
MTSMNSDPVGGSRSSEHDKLTTVFRKWWFWAAAGVVVLLIVIGTAGGPSAPRTAKLQHTGPRVTDRPSEPSPTTTTTHPPSVTSTTVPPTTTSVPSAPNNAPPGLQYGPGPERTYAVEPQPAAGSCHYRYVGNDPLPDPGCTPGALNPQVTQSTIGSTICESGYASSIRPPESITEPEKQASASAYRYAGSFSTGEYDHLVPLELGGDPNDPANLWIEPNDNPNAPSTANSKDVLENRLNDLVCSGQLSLAAAREAISSNWVTAYQKYIGAQSAIPPTASPSPTSPSAPQPSGAASCAASAAPANDGYSGDYYVTVTSNQPNQKATASDTRNSWSDYTDSSGAVRILLYYVSPGEQIDVTVDSASCSTTA